MTPIGALLTEIWLIYFVNLGRFSYTLEYCTCNMAKEGIVGGNEDVGGGKRSRTLWQV